MLGEAAVLNALKKMGKIIIIALSVTSSGMRMPINKDAPYGRLFYVC